MKLLSEDNFVDIFQELKPILTKYVYNKIIKSRYTSYRFKNIKTIKIRLVLRTFQSHISLCFSPRILLAVELDLKAKTKLRLKNTVQYYSKL